MDFKPPTAAAAKEHHGWTDQQRRLAWFVICRSRKNLNLEISPIVAKAFIILQNYFRCTDNGVYKLFILMIAALFSSCKASKSFRSMETIFHEISRICTAVPMISFRGILGSDDDQSVTFTTHSSDVILEAELALLSSIDWNPNFELPFEHLDHIKSKLIELSSNPQIMALINSVMVQICLLVCSSHYLDIPPEVVAATAAELSVPPENLGEENMKWISTLREKYGSDCFELARESIMIEKSRTSFSNQPIVH